MVKFQRRSEGCRAVSGRFGRRFAFSTSSWTKRSRFARAINPESSAIHELCLVVHKLRVGFLHAEIFVSPFQTFLAFQKSDGQCSFAKKGMMFLARFTERSRAYISVATTRPSIFKTIPRVPVSSKMQEIMKSSIFQWLTALSRDAQNQRKCHVSNEIKWGTIKHIQ